MIRPRQFSKSSRCWPVVAMLLLCAGAARIAQAADPEPPIVQAPPNHEVVEHTRGGVYYVAKDLKERHDKLIQQLKSLKDQVDGADIPGDEALKQLQSLKRELEQLQKQIAEKRVLVTPTKAHTQTETMKFELGPKRLLVVTADHLTVVGWDGPGIKCVFEKTVLTTDDKPVDEHLKGIRLVHRHGSDSELVGRTDDEVDADEKKFLASPDGQKLIAKLNEEQLANRRRYVREIANSDSGYRDFQGQEFDALAIEGLTHEQGNRNITMRTASEGGGGSSRSQWQRHATLTVYVPACQAVALRGCLVGLDVKGLKSKLLVTRSGERDRDYAGRFEIRDHQGDVRIEQAPIQRIENVRGDVSLLMTEEFLNYSTSHHDGWRTANIPPAAGCFCKHIIGDFSAQIGRLDLRLEEIAGQVDVRNDFGNTTLVTNQPLAATAHLLISKSGRVEAVFAKAALGDLPVMAMTSHGKASTNTPRGSLDDDVNFSSTDPRLKDHPGWRGFYIKSANDSQRSFATCFERTSRVIAGEDRIPGLDLISLGGTVVVRVLSQR